MSLISRKMSTLSKTLQPPGVPQPPGTSLEVIGGTLSTEGAKSEQADSARTALNRCSFQNFPHFVVVVVNTCYLTRTGCTAQAHAAPATLCPRFWQHVTQIGVFVVKEAGGSRKNRAVNPSWARKSPRGVGGTAPTLQSCQFLPSGGGRLRNHQNWRLLRMSQPQRCSSPSHRA